MRQETITIKVSRNQIMSKILQIATLGQNHGFSRGCVSSPPIQIWYCYGPHEKQGDRAMSGIFL